VIPSAFVQEWSATTPWPDPLQVEQDLIISERCATLSTTHGSQSVWHFRGGTAINKLSLRIRYSEDIDLVQVQPDSIGPTVDAIRRVLSWLGPCRRKAAPHSMHLVFAFAPDGEPSLARAPMIANASSDPPVCGCLTG